MAEKHLQNLKNMRFGPSTINNFKCTAWVTLNPLPDGKMTKKHMFQGHADEKLTPSQKTNFTLFQTERVCRRQFQTS